MAASSTAGKALAGTRLRTGGSVHGVWPMRVDVLLARPAPRVLGGLALNLDSLAPGVTKLVALYIESLATCKARA